MLGELSVDPTSGLGCRHRFSLRKIGGYSVKRGDAKHREADHIEGTWMRASGVGSKCNAVSK